MIPLDLKRLLDHDVELFGFDLEAIWKVIQAFVRHCDQFATEQGDIKVATKEELRKFQSDNPYRFILARDYPEQSVELALTELLRQPRILKHALRRTWKSWQTLHGEVSLDDLLVYNTIHTINSDAVAFIRDHWSSLALDRESDQDKKKKSNLPNLWKASMSRASDQEKIWLWSLMNFLFPGLESYANSKLQGIERERCWHRISNSRIKPKEVRDQQVLKNMKAWKDSGDASAIVQGLMTDSQYTSVFEDLFETQRAGTITLEGEELLKLATLVIERMRKYFGRDANPDKCPGFIALWRLQHRGNRHFTNYAKWLWAEVEKTLVVSLRLSNELEYYWGSKKYSQLNTADLEQIRLQVVQWANKNINAESLCRTLSSETPHALLHFMAGAPHDGKLSEPMWEKWLWISDVILNALNRDPKLMIPQVTVLFSKSEGKIRDNLLDDESILRTMTIYHLKKDWVRRLFRDSTQRHQFAEAILKPTSNEETWPSDIQDMISKIRKEIGTWQYEGLE